jgi:hypothetical protein
MTSIVGETKTCAYTGKSFVIESDGYTFNYAVDAGGNIYSDEGVYLKAKADLEAGAPCCGYMSDNCITTWKGQKLMNCSAWLIRKYSFSEVWGVHAYDRKGRLWKGRSGGTGMWANLKLAKR